MNKLTFYHCQKCQELVWRVHNSGAPLSCGDGELVELIPGTTDAALEKHVPVIEVNGNTVTVKVGEVPHPMLEEHFIGMVVLQTADDEAQVKVLHAGEAPSATFTVADGNAPMIAYEWCNLHGLWLSEK